MSVWLFLIFDFLEMFLTNNLQFLKSLSVIKDLINNLINLLKIVLVFLRYKQEI